MEFGDEMNDETFGVDVSTIQNQEFRFGQQQNGQRVMTVEELERQFSQQAVQPPTTRNVMSLAEIEASLLQPTPVQPVAIADPGMSEEERVHRQKYNGLMSQAEKDLVAKIQLGQLTNDPTYETDFYFKAFINARSALSGSTASPSAADENKNAAENKTSDEEAKFQKMLSEVKAHKKNRAAASVELKGSLGKVIVNSLRNPKPLMEINIKRVEPTDAESDKNSVKRVLNLIESCYSDLMKVDDLYLEFQQDANPSRQHERNSRYTTLIKSLWFQLHNITSTPTKEDSQRLLKTPPVPASLAFFMSFSKGRKALAKITRALPKEQAFLLLYSIITCMQNLALRSTHPVDVLAELEEYATHVVFPFVQLISEAPMSYVLDTIENLVKQNAAVPLAKNKPGMLFLTLLMSRAELFKQKTTQSGSANSDEEAKSLVTRWDNQVFPAFFAAFQNRFASLFPPSHIIPPIVTSSSLTIPQPIPVDDTYVWNFFAALAASSAIEQHRVLVAEARDKIFEVITAQGTDGKRKVNLFLNALGLDASQLMD